MLKIRARKTEYMPPVKQQDENSCLFYAFWHNLARLGAFLLRLGEDRSPAKAGNAISCLSAGPQ